MAAAATAGELPGRQGAARSRRAILPRGPASPGSRPGTVRDRFRPLYQGDSGVWARAFDSPCLLRLPWSTAPSQTSRKLINRAMVIQPKTTPKLSPEKNSMMDIIFSSRWTKLSGGHRPRVPPKVRWGFDGASFLSILMNNSWEPAGNWQKCLFCHRQNCLTHPLLEGRIRQEDAHAEPLLSGKGLAWLRQTAAN